MPLDLDQITTEELSGRSHNTPNPLFNYLTGFVPRKLKDSFKLVEYLYFNSPHISAALNKLSDYSVTDVVYETDSSSVKEKLRELMEQDLHIKQVLKAASRDRMIYGNSFVSIYLPFDRYLKCINCKTSRNIKKVNYKYKWKPQTFEWNCAKCKGANSTKIDAVDDRKLTVPRRMNVIRWDPKSFDIDYNPITGQSIYFYTIPKDVKSKVQAGNKHLLNTIPLGFLKAIKEDKIFEFSEDQVFHMKVDAPAGIDTHWGFGPMLAVIKQYLYTAVLQKANEAIALEHIVPFRVLHPAQTSTNGDPTMMLNLNHWMQETRDNLKQWRRDPNHLQLSPIALGSTVLGGDGKVLMTLAETEAAENSIMAGLGIPREFLYGGLSFSGSSVTLRMLENQLLNQTRDLEDLMNWAGEKICKYLNWPVVRMSLTPFKLVDDVQQKQVMLALNQTGQVISNTTMANVFGYDLAKERKLREQEQLDEIRSQTETQQKIQKMQNTLSSQAKSKAQQGQVGMTYDQQAVIGAADQIVQQLMQLDPGMKKSQLHALQTEDMVLYSVVVQRMEQAQKDQATQAVQAATQPAGGAQ